MRTQSHAENDIQRHEQPRQIEQQHDNRLRCRIFPGKFLDQDDDHVTEHHPAVDQAGRPDPFFASGEGVQRDHVKRPEEQHVDPDCGFPPGRPRDQDWIEGVAVVVDRVDHEGGRPHRIREMIGVGDDKLFEIDNVRNEQQVDREK